jgi:hypothetical protein
MYSYYYLLFICPQWNDVNRNPIQEYDCDRIIEDDYPF